MVPLERGAEGERAAVADLAGDAGDRGVAAGQQVGRQRHPPAGEVPHRRLTHGCDEASGQPGPGDTDVAGQRRHGPWLRRLVVEQREGLGGHRVVRAVQPGRRGDVGGGAPVLDDGDDERIEQTVEKTGLSRPLPVDLRGEQVDQRGAPVGRPRHDVRRQGREQPAPDLAHALVGPDQHRRGAVGGVAPRADALAHRQLEALSVGRLAALAGVDHGLGRAVGAVRDDVRLGAADKEHVTRGQRDRVAAVRDEPRRAGGEGDDRQRRPVLHPDRPRRSHRRPGAGMRCAPAARPAGR